MTPERPNYYLLLELDPSVDDWAAIDEKIKEQKQRWSKQVMGAPAAARKAKHNLSLIGKMTEVLKDPSARKQEAQEARRHAEKERQEKFRELDEHIDVLLASGGYLDADLAALCKQMAGRLSEAEIEARARSKGLSRKAAAAGESIAARPKLESALMQKIREALEFLHVLDLYAFLKLTGQSPARTLRERADQLNREILSIGKTDTDAQMRKDLCGYCMAVFRDEEQRKRYDNSLTIEAMHGLLPQIETAGRDGQITQEELEVLVRKAMERRVQSADALAFIEEHARGRKWLVARPQAQLPTQDLPQCGFCLMVAEQRNSTRCRKCGELLSPPCPSCGASTPSSEQACRQCGTVLAAAPLIRALMQEGKSLQAQGDFIGALRQFDQALVYWPKYQDAQTARKNVQAQQAHREDALAQVEKLVQAHRLREARTALDRFARTFGEADLETLSRRIDEDLARADAALRQGQELLRHGKKDAAIARFEEALRLCADLEPAKQALAAAPPATPKDLRLSSLREGVRLDWSAVPEDGAVRYRVVRKAKVRPTAPEDGETLTEVTVPRFDDIKLDSGTVYCYAVYCVRGEVFSRDAATSEPFAYMPEVAELAAVSGNASVTLRFRAPKGCRVEVYRRTDKAPASRRDGAAIPVAGEQVIDQGLSNGIAAYYLVVAVYDDPGRPGQESVTRGLSISAVPQAPPPPVMDLRGQRAGQTVELSFTPPAEPAGTTVQLRRARASIAEAPGQAVSIQQLSRFGELVPLRTPSTAQVSLDGQGQVVFVPISVCNTTAVLGRPLMVTTLDEVHELKAGSNGTDILLSWTWPAGTKEVKVCYTLDRYPELPSQAGQTVSRQTYERDNGYTLRAGKRSPHYITVFTRAEGSETYSTGARVFEGMGQEPKVSYQVVIKKALLTRSISDVLLELSTSAPVRLPPLRIVAKDNGLPTSQQDGQTIATLDATALEMRSTVKIAKEHWSGKRFIKLFFVDPTAAREIRLLPATAEQLRLG